MILVLARVVFVSLYACVPRDMHTVRVLPVQHAFEDELILSFSLAVGSCVPCGSVAVKKKGVAESGSH